MKKSNKAQEEMVGFALIIVIVSVIIIVFLAFMLNTRQEEVESYEVESYIQAALQYTSDCQDNLGYLDNQKLIFECIDKTECLDGRNTCDVLKTNLEGITKESWNTGSESSTKGYKMIINSDNRSIVSLEEGNETKNSKGQNRISAGQGNL